jgi:hypothetical protein
MCSGCLATLPPPFYAKQTEIFKDQDIKLNAESCGGHLTSLRSNAKWSSYGRLTVTLLSGTTTAASAYFAATNAADDPQKAETAAQVALVSGLISVAATLIPDPTDALDKHRRASSSWEEARRLARTDREEYADAFLTKCKNNEGHTPVPKEVTEKLEAPAHPE